MSVLSLHQLKTLMDETTPQHRPVELAERTSSVTWDKIIMNSCSESSGETPASSREARVNASPGVHRATHQGAGGKYIWANILWCYILSANMYKLINKIKYFE